MTRVKQLGWLGVLLATLFLAAGAALAQESGVRDLRHAKVVSVDGNTVVVWDQFGGQEYTVPEGFQFTADDKEVAVGDLKPGMQVQADVNQGVTVRPVHITEIKMGTVVSQVGRTVTVKDENGAIHRFTQSEADDRGVRLVMDDKAARISELNAGDQLTATIVSADAPEILTAQDLDAELAGEPVAAAADAAEDTAAAAETAVDEAASGEADSMVWLWVLLVIIAAAILIWIFASRRKPTTTRPTTTK
jgi:hypothetical protein